MSHFCDVMATFGVDRVWMNRIHVIILVVVNALIVNLAILILTFEFRLEFAFFNRNRVIRVLFFFGVERRKEFLIFSSRFWMRFCLIFHIWVYLMWSSKILGFLWVQFLIWTIEFVKFASISSFGHRTAILRLCSFIFMNCLGSERLSIWFFFNEIIWIHFRVLYIVPKLVNKFWIKFVNYPLEQFKIIYLGIYLIMFCYR